MESFHDKLRSECLNREWFLSTRQAKVLIEQWRHFYNEERPHEALGQKPPARVYAPSPRAMPERLPEPDYPAEGAARRVLGFS